MSKIILIGCGKSKVNHREAARDLYTGSLFVARRKHAELSGNAWFIISAKYGLTRPEVMLDPYDLKISQLPILDRYAWAMHTAAELLDDLPDSIDTAKMLREVVVEVHAGADYAELLRDPILAAGMSFSWPVKGMSQGEQMQYYATQRVMSS